MYFPHVYVFLYFDFKITNFLRIGSTLKNDLNGALYIDLS